MGLFSKLKQRLRSVTATAGVAEKAVDGVKDRLGGGRARPSAPTDSKMAPAAAVRPLVIGLFDNLPDAEIALNNLDEAGYAPSSISAITADAARTQTLTDVHGAFSDMPPGQLADVLMALGLPATDGKTYRAAITVGAVCLIIAAPAGSEAAGEILTDQKGRLVHILGSRATGS